MLPNPLPGTPATPPPEGHNRPVPDGYKAIRTASPQIVGKSNEILGSLQYKIGTQFLITVDGQEYLFALEWHKHAASDHVSENLKHWHRGVTVYSSATKKAANIPNPAVPADSAGLDVSNYQPHVDWKKVALTADFVFIKASESTGVTDKSFSSHWAGAKAAGLLRAAYHFFHGNQDGATQAAHFLKVMGLLDDCDLPPIIDLEHSGGAKPDMLSKQVSTWVQAVEGATGRKPIIYVSPSFWNEHMAARTDKFPYGDYPLWIAHYGVHKPSLPRDNVWSDWTFWQFTEKGKQTGIHANVDLDKFNGSVLSLWQFLGVSEGMFGDPITTALKFPEWLFSFINHEASQIEALVNQPTAKYKVPNLNYPNRANKAAKRIYVVQAGDTLATIASKCEVGMQDLAQMNGLPNANCIRTGQVLRIT